MCQWRAGEFEDVLFLWIDTLYQKVRVEGRVVAVAVMIAGAVNGRELPSDVSDGILRIWERFQGAREDVFLLVPE